MNIFTSKGIRFLRNLYEDRPVEAMFVIISIVLIIISAVFAVFTCGDSFINILFKERGDYLTDFFSSVAESLDNPYSDKHVIYPPLTVLAYGCIGKIISFFVDPIVGVPYADQMRESVAGLAVYFSTVLIFYILLVIVLVKFNKKRDKKLFIIEIFLLVLSYPILFSIDRGNSIIFSFIFCLLFVLMYSSENRYVRYLSHICLAVAVSIKIFPIFFWVLILRERRWGESILCLFIISIVFLSPFLLTDGSLSILIDNATTYVSSGDNMNGIINIRNMVYAFIPNDLELVSRISTVLSYLYLVLCTLAIILDKQMDRWQAILLAASMLVLGPGFGAEYLLIYVMIPLIVFLNACDENSKYTICVAIVFALVLSIIPEFVDYRVIGSYKSVLFALLSFTILVLSYRRMLGNVFGRNHVAEQG